MEEFNRLRQLFDLAQKVARMGTWELDVATGRAYWSDMVYEIHEVEVGQEYYISQGVSFYHPDDQPRLMEGIKDAIQSQRPYDIKARIQTAKGNLKWIRTTCTPIIENGKVIRLMGIFQDITKEENDKQSILKQEKFSRKLLSNMLEGFSVLDTQGKQISVNEAFCNMTGFTESELIGTLPPHPYWCEEELEKTIRAFKQLRDTGSGTFELTFKKKSGERLPVLINASYIKDENDKITHYFANVLDMSKTFRSQSELKQVLELTKDQNARLKNFASIVSHNLRSHVSGLMGVLDLIEMSNPSIYENEYIQLLKKASNNLSQTIQDLSEVANSSLTSQEKMEIVHMRTAIQRILSGIASIAKMSSIEIHTNIPESIQVRVIPSYFDSIILNLVTNSLKYRDPRKKSEIELFTIENENFTILKVKDNGLGIDLNRHGDKIFGMYKTFHKSSDSRGVGLYITKNQIESMGGRIEVESEPGIGSTFSVYFKNW